MEKVYLRPLKLTQAYESAPWRNQMIALASTLIVVIVVGVVAGFYVNVTSRAAELGRQIQWLKSENQRLQRETADLETQFAMLTSASMMEKRAVELGFVPVSPDQIFYVTVPGYTREKTIQMAPPTSLVTVTEQELPGEFTMTLIEWVRLQVAGRVARGEAQP